MSGARRRANGTNAIATVPDLDRCAGCGRKILVGDGAGQIDGAIIHIGDPEQVECLAIHGAQWRSAAAVGLMALGLMKP